MENWFMKKPCEHCPYRRDVKPFLHPERGAELAYCAENSYNSFSCHKTTVEDEDNDEGEMLVTERSKECAGFMTLQHIESGTPLPKGFKPDYDIIYDSSWDMVNAYEEEAENKNL